MDVNLDVVCTVCGEKVQLVAGCHKCYSTIESKERACLREMLALLEAGHLSHYSEELGLIKEKAKKILGERDGT